MTAAPTSSPKRPIRSIACVGEVMIELVADADGSAQLGVAGDSYNTAVYLARLLEGSDIGVSYVTALGADPYSDRIRDAITSHGINADCIEMRPEHMPGLYAIDTDDHGERSFSYWRSQSAARTLFSAPCEITLDHLNTFDLVLFSGISLAILPPAVRSEIYTWADAYKAGGGTLAYDSNHRPRLWESVDVARDVNAQMWSRADLALPSVDDEMAIYAETTEAEVLARLRALGVSRGALKRGDQGPLELTSDRTPDDVARVGKVVDSTAAGDSFNAGYLAAIAQGGADLDAARAGHNLAAKVITHRGAIIPKEAHA